MYVRERILFVLTFISSYLVVTCPESNKAKKLQHKEPNWLLVGKITFL
jgi:hypothetical protein